MLIWSGLYFQQDLINYVDLIWSILSIRSDHVCRSDLINSVNMIRSIMSISSDQFCRSDLIKSVHLIWSILSIWSGHGCRYDPIKSSNPTQSNLSICSDRCQVGSTCWGSCRACPAPSSPWPTWSRPSCCSGDCTAQVTALTVFAAIALSWPLCSHTSYYSGDCIVPPLILQ